MSTSADAASVGDILSIASDASSILTFVAVVFLAFWGGRARIAFIASRKTHFLSKVKGPGNERLAPRFGRTRATYQRIWKLARAGEPWSVSSEITWLSDLDLEDTGNQLVWGRPALVPDLVSNLVLYLRFLETSFIARVGDRKSHV